MTPRIYYGILLKLYRISNFRIRYLKLRWWNDSIAESICPINQITTDQFEKKRKERFRSILRESPNLISGIDLKSNYQRQTSAICCKSRFIQIHGSGLMDQRTGPEIEKITRNHRKSSNSKSTKKKRRTRRITMSFLNISLFRLKSVIFWMQERWGGGEWEGGHHRQLHYIDDYYSILSTFHKTIRNEIPESRWKSDLKSIKILVKGKASLYNSPPSPFPSLLLP